ncbi:GntR family transcriptional regulator [Jiangella rhizosphaerae]|uniref:GntR family transcriptional regulator n=2 Tax=Jiangella rhizosphaerae TaxID=2293569 RepID=A0A418KL60_9ACTN|nr:GntR family transcriptional regulator [Jiangella rhizosphaerae]
MRPSGKHLRTAVADDLRRAIETGELPPGATLPTEPVLMQRYGVSRNTVRNALGDLENAGLIEVRQGRGRQVRRREPVWIYASRSESRARRRPSGVDSWVDDMRSQGRVPRTDIEVAVLHAPVDVSERLNLDNGATVAVRRRIRFADDQPWNMNDSYYPMWLAQEVPAILDPADVTTGLTVHLADRGYAQVYYNDELTARMPTPDEAKALNIGPGVPVMCHMRTGVTKGGKPIRVTVTVMPGDRHRLLYEVPA